MENSRASEFSRSRSRSKHWLVAILLTVGSTASAGIIHDLSDEFSTTQNPSSGSANGWGYNAAGFGGPVGPFGQYSPGDFGGGQLGWRDPSAEYLGWTQITNAGGYGAPADAFDIQNGDVITHAATSIAWQAQAGTDGLYTIDISAWQIRDLDRSVDLQLWKNDSQDLTGVITLSNVGPANSSRANPLVVASGLIVQLNVNEYVRLTLDGGDYVGVNFQLVSVPEVSSVFLASGSAAVLLLAATIRRRRSLDLAGRS